MRRNLRDFVEVVGEVVMSGLNYSVKTITELSVRIKITDKTKMNKKRICGLMYLGDWRFGTFRELFRVERTRIVIE